MTYSFVKKVAAAALAAGITMSASTFAFAAPIGMGSAALKTAAPNDNIDVYYRYRGWRGGPWIAGGIIAGVLGGAAIANSRYYGNPYYYYGGGPAYPVYNTAPEYYYDAPVPSLRYQATPAYPRRCWVESGPNGVSGYWQPC